MKRSWCLLKLNSLWRKPPSNAFLLSMVLLVVLTALLSSSPLHPSVPSFTTSPLSDIYGSYRRLREQAVADLTEIRSLSQGMLHPQEFDLCGKELENYVPCYNITANQIAGFHNGEELDRHCEVSSLVHPCLVRPPKDYKIPIRWPAGRDVIWSGNVKITKDQFLSSGSMTKRLMLLEENQIAFHSDDGAIYDGVKDYSHQIAEMIGLSSVTELRKAGIQTVLDIGCGFGSFGAHLFSVKLTTICVAAYETFGSQVQLALERGLPAIIGNFLSRQLPYPPLSFDVVHCAQCGINWHEKDGAFLIEADRVIRPGGYFVLTSSLTINMKSQNMISYVEEFADKICWSLLAQQDETFVWQKTVDSNCYGSRKHGDKPFICKEGYDEGSYYQSLPSCISGTNSDRWIPIQNRSHPQLSQGERILHGVQKDEFDDDVKTWKSTISDYWSLLTPLIFSDHPKRPGDEDPLPPFNMVRNVMDMNAHYGGFNNALLEAGKSIWVMNVVPVRTPNTLPLILDRGFAGILHDWCEPFPTYPRTYDMLHAKDLISHHINSEGCDLSDLLLEMDRILRPEGWVVLCDKVEVINMVRIIATQVRWDARVIELPNNNEQRLLVCQKPFLRK